MQAQTTSMSSTPSTSDGRRIRGSPTLGTRSTADIAQNAHTLNYSEQNERFQNSAHRRCVPKAHSAELSL